MSVLAVVDYNAGNLHSVVKALELTAPSQTSVVLTSDAEQIARADRVVFPGQGSARACMSHLRQSGLYDAVNAAVRTKVFLGICMGMELMFEHSEEGDIDCMGVRPGCVRLLQAEQPRTNERFRLPHIGWNRIQLHGRHSLWSGIPDRSWFYFLHSYAWTDYRSKWCVASSFYGQNFAASASWENVFCVQFHPEKSSEMGLRLLRNFHLWNPE